MKRLFFVLLVLASFNTFAQKKTTTANNVLGKEYHVSINGNDTNIGSAKQPFKTIMAAANKAMPGDVITVHEGVYHEEITPPRGGNSSKEPIVYQAAKGENVVIKGSEVIKGWKQTEKDTWVVKIPNTFFGKFNPYKETIHGDWFIPTPKDRKYLRGAVYLNGVWLMEAAKKEEVVNAAADAKNPLWCASVNADSTIIWAQFKNTDPNKELVEINVRPAVFYPDKPFMNFITVRGFTLEQAATNWAPPTAEQIGLIGTNWSKGWIIENNVIRYSKCVGLTLGKYGDKFDNNDTESAEGYVGTINRALAFGWNKGTVGSHLVRNNTISNCEQAGIVGSMGCSFSVIEGNTVFDIYRHRLFKGFEQGAMKFHGAIDMQIRNNHVYRGRCGLWLDWMAQGTQVTNNLMHDNECDVVLEVNHGSVLISNNILLSKGNFQMHSSGIAVVHNILGGGMTLTNYDARLTPYHKSHSTAIAGLHDNQGGDIQFVNNLFIGKANASQYAKSLLPITFDGNVYTKGTVRAIGSDKSANADAIDTDPNAQLKANKEQKSVEQHEVVNNEFDAIGNLSTEKEGVYLEINLDKDWLKQSRELVTTKTLHPAIIPNLPFENADGSPLLINVDYFGKSRNTTNPSPGPFEIKQSGIQKIKVYK
jgi:alpha-N-arabinofuranosidase